MFINKINSNSSLQESSPKPSLNKYKTATSQKEKEILSFYSKLIKNPNPNPNSTYNLVQDISTIKHQDLIASSSEKSFNKNSFNASRDEAPFSEEKITLINPDQNKQRDKNAMFIKLDTEKSFLKESKTDDADPEKVSLRLEVEKWKKFGNLMADAHEEINERLKEAKATIENQFKVIESMRDKVKHIY